MLRKYRKKITTLIVVVTANILLFHVWGFWHFFEFLEDVGFWYLLDHPKTDMMIWMSLLACSSAAMDEKKHVLQSGSWRYYIADKLAVLLLPFAATVAIVDVYIRPTITYVKVTEEEGIYLATTATEYIMVAVLVFILVFRLTLKWPEQPWWKTVLFVVGFILLFPFLIIIDIAGGLLILMAIWYAGS